MSDPFRGERFPKGALYGAAALIGFALIMTLGARLEGIGAARTAAAEPAEIHVLRFEDRADGAIVVHDTQSDSVRAVIDPGTNGFIRGVLRGLARERKRADVGMEPPFHLIRGVDGRLTLKDPSTGEVVNLGSFGPTNVAAFARLLDPENESS